MWHYSQSRLGLISSVFPVSPLPYVTIRLFCVGHYRQSRLGLISSVFTVSPLPSVTIRLLCGTLQTVQTRVDFSCLYKFTPSFCYNKTLLWDIETVQTRVDFSCLYKFTPPFCYNKTFI